MDALTLEAVSKRFGQVVAVDGVDLAVPRGKLVCFLGPSGCGKTTLLRLIAGLETPSSGRILVGARDIGGVPAHKRNFGMVFQSLALFPHLTVGENVAYSLRIRGEGRRRQRQRAEELLELVRLPGLADRHTAQLSGGQRQRVAMARALALEPELFLLDEPLSALDAKLREEMQVELRQLQQRVGVTTVLVTHDQREAMTMADLVMVMDEGRVQQVGSPLDIYRRPANTFVADFIGTSNLLDCTVADDGAVSVDGTRFAAAAPGRQLSAGTAATLSIRPEEVHVLPGAQPGDNRLVGSVDFVRDVGADVELYVACGARTVTAHTSPKDRPAVGLGETATVELPAAACVVLAE